MADKLLEMGKNYVNSENGQQMLGKIQDKIPGAANINTGELINAFTKGNGNQLIILFKINLKRTDFKIENRKPFIPIEILDSPIHTYSDVISILESINNPISRNTFTDINENPFWFSYHGKHYVLENIEEPLIVQQ